MSSYRQIFSLPADLKKRMNKVKRNWSAFVKEAIEKELGCHKDSVEERLANLEKRISKLEETPGQLIDNTNMDYSKYHVGYVCIGNKKYEVTAYWERSTVSIGNETLPFDVMRGTIEGYPRQLYPGVMWRVHFKSFSISMIMERDGKLVSVGSPDEDEMRHLVDLLKDALDEN